MMKNNILPFLFISFSAFVIQAQTINYDYSEIDSVSKKINYPGKLQDLADTLTLNLDQDHLKARSIFSWIAFHIEYDNAGLKDRSILKTEPDGVIENGKSVCQGYANLFKELCTLSGLEAEVIVGWGRNSSRFIGKTNFKSSDHAWNAVKIDGEWKLIDVTWASGYSERKGFIQVFNDSYFFTSSESLILNHYPKDEKWLLGIDCTQKKFDQQPYYMSEYLSLNISELNQTVGVLKPNFLGKTTFTFIYDGDVKSILGTGTGKDRKVQNVKFTKENELVTFKFKVKKKSLLYTIFLNNIGIIEYRTLTK